MVDDDRAVRDSLKFALELEGLAVTTCASGVELLLAGDAGQADCLVLDYKMPDMDGLALMDELVRNRVAAPVILITAPVSDALRQKARRAGVFSVLEKPLNDGILLENVRRAIAA